MGPQSRNEQYLAKIAGENADLPEFPQSRTEQYLAKIAGEDVEVPEHPQSRAEEYLAVIAEGGGGGGDVDVEPLSVTENGTYTAPTGKAYSPVVVNVPNSYAAGDEGKVVSNGALVSQTSKNISANGTVDTTTNDEVVVAVPNSYTAGDEDKVVHNGALVAQTSDTVTQNGTVDTTLINSLLVNVSGGGGLEYETGAWTPTVDTGQGQIYFAKTHTNLPCLVALSDTSEASTSVSSSVMAWTYYEAYTMWGAAMPQSPSVLKYGVIEWVYTSGSSSSQGNVILSYSPTSGSSSRLYPRYWVDEAWFKPYAYNTNYIFRAGRTYKWIAIWAPSS